MDLPFVHQTAQCVSWTFCRLGRNKRSRIADQRRLASSAQIRAQPGFFAETRPVPGCQINGYSLPTPESRCGHVFIVAHGTLVLAKCLDSIQKLNSRRRVPKIDRGLTNEPCRQHEPACFSNYGTIGRTSCFLQSLLNGPKKRKFEHVLEPE